jgi:hypothetical protein
MTDLFETKLAFAPISDDPEREQAILDDADEVDKDEDESAGDEEDSEDDDEADPKNGIDDDGDGGIEE